VNRLESQELAKRKLVDAEAMLAASRWSAAYYHCGYVIECALKACILARLENDLGLFFEERRYQEKCWGHDLAGLLRLANLEPDFLAECSSNSNLVGFWGIVNAWNEASRYKEWTESQARLLFEAVNDSVNGAFQWIQLRW